MLKPFCSSLNKVLLDYKHFKGFLNSAIRGTAYPENEYSHLLANNRSNLSNDIVQKNPTQQRIEFLKKSLRNSKMITPRRRTENNTTKPSQSITPKQAQYDKESPYQNTQNDAYHHETKSQQSSRKGSLAHSMNKMRQNQDILSQTASRELCTNLLMQRKDDLPESNKEWL